MLADKSATLPVLWVALDLSPDDAVSLAQELAGVVDGVKVGSTLFSRCGPSIVQRFRELGLEVFLDLKLHDIPHQVGLATQALVDLDVALLTVHTAGGSAMMRAAAEAARGSSTRVVGVTVLTSMDAAAMAEVAVNTDVAETVAMRAALAAQSGLDGVVASPREAAAIRADHPKPFLIVTPGIRPGGGGGDDQRRVATPADALAAGADALVVGRPIAAAPDPRSAAAEIIAAIRSSGENA